MASIYFFTKLLIMSSVRFNLVKVGILIQCNIVLVIEANKKNLAYVARLLVGDWGASWSLATQAKKNVIN